MPDLSLDVLPEALAICRLPAADPDPPWARGSLVSVTRTRDELSVVCPVTAVPAGVTAEAPWRALRVAGTLDFALTGILAGLSGTLAAAGVPCFALSTFDTDYLLVRDSDLDRASAALTRDGYRVVPST